MTTGLLVVDVQPSYDSWCRHVAESVATRINNTVKPVTLMWVGDGLTNDTEYDVRDYLRSHGARKTKLAEAQFIEKDYGFFRPWMDSGIDYSLIVKVVKQLLSTNVKSSSGLDLESMLGDDFCDKLAFNELHIPQFRTEPFQYLSGFETCGGGSDECLAEIEIWLESQNKQHKRIKSMVY